MRAIAMVVMVHVACARGGDGASIEQEARQIVGIPNMSLPPDDGANERATSSGSILPDAWICTDPISLEVQPQERTIHVRSRAVERGGAGVMVRYGGGAFCVRARVRVDRVALAAGVEFGLSPVGGVASCSAEALVDASTMVQFVCAGGEGDIRHLISLQSTVKTGGQQKLMGSFELGQDVEVMIRSRGCETIASVRSFGRMGFEHHARLAETLPPGLYQLGCMPRAGRGGVIVATVELLAIDEDLVTVPAASLPLPDWLRDSARAPRAGPLLEILGPLTGDSDWSVVLTEVRPRITRIRSLLGRPAADDDERPSWLLQAWFEAGSLRRAPPASRMTNTIGPLHRELGRALTQRASHPHTQAEIIEWLGPGMDADLTDVKRATLLLHLAELEPTICVQRYSEALAACPADAVAWRLWGSLKVGDPLPEVLKEYVLRSAADPWLVAGCCELVLASGELDTAKVLAARALANGVCDDRLGDVLAGCNDSEELRVAWAEARADGLRLLRELLQRQRWMGLAESAAVSARVLLHHDRSPGIVRDVIPSLMLAREKEILLTLLRDTDQRIREAAEAGLNDDHLLVELRANLIADLRRGW